MKMAEKLLTKLFITSLGFCVVLSHADSGTPVRPPVPQRIQGDWDVSEFEEVRKFTTVINPGCEGLYNSTNCSTFRNITLLHIKSDGRGDSFHFLWSFVGAPTLLMARTPLDSVLHVDWTGLFEESGTTPSIIFDPPALYSFGWSLVKIWVADDKKDVASLDKMDQGSVHGFETKRFIWERMDNVSYANSTHIRYTLMAKEFDYLPGGRHSLGPSGYFKFTIRMKSSTGYSDVLPYMLYTENSTQVDIAFNDVQLNDTQHPLPTHPRIGFKYILVQDEVVGNTSARMRLERTKTLDDEHTPGVFETFSVRTPILNTRDESFIQWKPICYTGEVRDVIDSVDVWSYPLQSASSVNNDDNVQDSILYGYYGANIENMLLEAMNISFGTQQDGYYTKTKHISWTYSTGFGKPPTDFISPLVFIIVAIGLGIPALIIILSISYILVKRLKRPRDELLLSR